MFEAGTTQGDPLAMPMNTLMVVPLTNNMSDDFIKQVWYTNNATACGCLSDLQCWWDHLVSTGPSYAYFLTHLIKVKPAYYNTAVSNFHDSVVLITAEVKHHLGSCFGHRFFCYCVCSSKNFGVKTQAGSVI